MLESPEIDSYPASTSASLQQMGRSLPGRFFITYLVKLPTTRLAPISKLKSTVAHQPRASRMGSKLPQTY